MKPHSHGERVYRLLLRAYPAGFRALYADDMVLTFRDCRREAQQEGKMVWLWMHTLLDLFATASHERLRRTGYRRAKHMDTTSFNTQLTATVNYWTRAMRGGYSLKQVFEMLAEKAPEPTATVFRETLIDATETGDWVGAISRMKARVPSEQFALVIDATLKQRETGGNLADLLDEVNAGIRAALGSDGWSEGVEFAE